MNEAMTKCRTIKIPPTGKSRTLLLILPFGLEMGSVLGDIFLIYID